MSAIDQNIKTASLSSSSEEEDGLTYNTGFNNHFQTSAVPNALPLGRNNPISVPCGLYAEQLSGTAFTSPRCDNRRSWLYRIRPGVAGTSSGGGFKPCGGDDGVNDEGSRRWRPRHFGGVGEEEMRLDPNPMRWRAAPFPANGAKVDFVNGMKLLMGSGSPLTKNGVGIYMYAMNDNMRRESEDDRGGKDAHLYNSDGDFLLVPQFGSLSIVTELGKLVVGPTEICVIPRGIMFSVNIVPPHSPSSASTNGDKFIPQARGYLLEIYKGHFQLPELGPIGSNGLANARDFKYPTASYETDRSRASRPCVILNKFGSQLFERSSPHSPYNVVAWHGNYAPYKYDLKRFCTMNSVSYDHPDPSIYTVLTVPGSEPGTALTDFVIFPPRIMATDKNTFRPPWYHRNTMTEFMGLIHGQYDAKTGFVPGGASLHSAMTPHGPDSDTYDKAVGSDCSQPSKFEGGLAFMFETSCMLKLSEYALKCDHRDVGYAECWDRLEDNFTGWDHNVKNDVNGLMEKAKAEEEKGRVKKRAKTS